MKIIHLSKICLILDIITLGFVKSLGRQNPDFSEASIYHNKTQSFNENNEGRKNIGTSTLKEEKIQFAQDNNHIFRTYTFQNGTSDSFSLLSKNLTTPAEFNKRSDPANNSESLFGPNNSSPKNEAEKPKEDENKTTGGANNINLKGISLPVLNYSNVSLLGNANNMSNEKLNDYSLPKESLPTVTTGFLNDVKIEVDLVSHKGDNNTQIMSKENVRVFEPPGAIKFYSPEAWKNRKLFNNKKTQRGLRLFMKRDTPQLRGFPFDIIVDSEKAEVKVLSDIEKPLKVMKLNIVKSGEERAAERQGARIFLRASSNYEN